MKQVDTDEIVMHLKSELKQAYKLLNEVLIRNNENEFDGNSYPCGHRPWCDWCDINDDETGCAMAYKEWKERYKE